ncbi:MAG: DEAD/DEAH box helicase, partial [Fibrobacterota bacterium]
MKKTAVFLNSPVSVLKNVGQRREAAFIKCSIASVSDLLNHTPLRYLDRTRITGLSDITEEGHYVFHGRVVKISEIPRKMLRVFIEDEKGGAVLLWFRVFQHIKKSISEGYFLFGAGDASFYKEGLQFAHPEIHMTKDERVEIPPEFRGFLPVYPISEAMRSNGIQNRMLRKIIKDALERLETDSCEEIPEIIRRKRLYPPLKEVYRKVHFPHEKHEMNLINRLKYSEIFIFLYKLAQFRRDNLVKGFACNNSRSAINMFLSRLGFKLTSAQEKVLDEIKSDMFSERRMYRLLQGDVGSGKTVIAALAALIAKYSGRQTVLMAPTSVLAEQHYDTFRKIFEYIGFHTILITGSLDDKEKTIAETAVSDGSADIIIGTHAAVSPSLRYHNLGLVIVDEQHRFG